MKTLMAVILLLLAFPLSGVATEFLDPLKQGQETTPRQEIQVLNQEIRPGDVILIRIPVEYVTQEARVHLFDKAFKPNKDGLVFVGVDLRTEPGVHSFYVIRDAIRQVDYGYQLTVLPKKVPTRKTRGPGADSARRRREAAQIASAYAKGNLDEFFVGEALANPLPDITETSPFAINHSGIDLRAALGTNVTAVGDGVVVMVARNFSLEGNMVIVDHGSGIFSLYMHLSRFLVKDMQKVEGGDVIGRSGATGRVSGPHLHFTVKVNGTNVDPLAFIEIVNSILFPVSR